VSAAQNTPRCTPSTAVYKVVLRRRFVEERVVLVRLNAPPTLTDLSDVADRANEDAYLGSDWKETACTSEEVDGGVVTSEEPDLDLTVRP
jgi:hypothetical protein